MKRSGLGRLGVVACCALPVAACGVFVGSAPPEPMSHTQAKSAARLAQLDFGRDALFARCLAPACPTRTPKTFTRESLGLPSPQRLTERTAALVPIASVAPAPAPAAIEPPPKRQIAHVVAVPFAFGSSRLENAAQARLEKAKRIPDLTVSMGARRNEDLGINQAILGLAIPIPVFDRNQGNLQEALSRTDKARDELQALQVQQSTLLASAHERFLAAQQEVGMIRSDILPGAQSAYDAAVKGFEFGKFGFLDVLDAQRTFFLARAQYLNAVLRGHQALAEIERLVGDIQHPAILQHRE